MMSQRWLAGAGVLAILAGGVGYVAARLTDHPPRPDAEHEAEARGSGSAPSESGRSSSWKPKRAETPSGAVRLTPAQIAAAGIQLAPATAGNLSARIEAPAVIKADPARSAQVSSRVPGVLVSISAGLGDRVKAGQTVAVVESRDVAEAAGEYGTSLAAAALARDTLSREADLFRLQVTAKQDYRQAQATARQAEIKAAVARQRLAAYGLSAGEIAGIARNPLAGARRQAVRAPISGQVVQQRAQKGAYVDASAAILDLSDPSTVWAQISVAPKDLGLVRRGQTVAIRDAGGQSAVGHVAFVSPTANDATRTAEVVAELPNASGRWRVGDFATAELGTEASGSALTVPADAVVTLNEAPTVFVRRGELFVSRPVRIGRTSGGHVEILSGLTPGEPVVVRGAFVLKAELGKASGEEGDADGK